MTLSLVNVDLPAISVLFEIESTYHERHPIPIRMYLGIGRDGQEGEILRLHG